MKNVFMYVIFLLLFASCESLFEEKILKKKLISSSPFPVVTNYYFSQTADFQNEYYATLTKTYFDSTELGSYCLNPLRSESQNVKIDKDGALTFLGSEPSIIPYQYSVFENTPYKISENTSGDLSISYTKYTPDFKENFKSTVSLNDVLKNEYKYFNGRLELFLAKNKILFYGGLSKTSITSSSFLALVENDKLSQVKVFENYSYILNAIKINNDEVLLLTANNVKNINIYFLVKYNLKNDKLEQVFEFPKDIKYISKTVKLSNTKFLFYGPSQGFNGEIITYDIESKKYELEKILLENITYKTININELKVFKNKQYFNITIDNEQSSYIFEVKETLKLKPLFKMGRNYNQFFLRSINDNKLELVEFSKENYNKYNERTLVKHHSSLTDVKSLILFDGVIYKSPCYRNK
jgi:hypothetical protein